MYCGQMSPNLNILAVREKNMGEENLEKDWKIKAVWTHTLCLEYIYIYIYIYIWTGNKSNCMKMYKYEKITSSGDDFIYSLNYLPTLNASVFEYENIKPSWGHLNC